MEITQTSPAANHTPLDTRDAIESHASRYSVSRCRLSRMGCTSVENGNAAHDRGSINHESLIALSDSSRAVLVASEYRRESRLNNPSSRYLDFKPAHQSKDIQDGFLVLNLRLAKVDFSASHDCGQIPAAEPL